MVSAEERFIYDVDSLRNILANPHSQNLLDASLILRRMLLDSHPLVHQVSRRYEFKLLFTVGGAIEDADVSGLLAEAEAIYMSIQPLSAAHSEVVGLDRFLSISIYRSASRAFTVRDIITFAANNAGGGHFDPPRQGHKYADLSGRPSNIAINGISLPLQPLIDIVSIYILAVEQLYKAIRC